jgi:hypothetical protein
MARRAGYATILALPAPKEAQLNHLGDDPVNRKSYACAKQGHVDSRQTRPTAIKGHRVRASEHEPQYIVESDNGGRASQNPAALTKE